MNLIAVVHIAGRHAGDAAVQPIAGRPWLLHVIERLRRARAVRRVVVVCPERHEHIESLAESVGAELLDAADPVHAVHALPGDHDGVVICPVTQLFIDPAQLDALAALPLQPEIARVFADLTTAPQMALTGGSWLEILTRAGLRDLAAGLDIAYHPSRTLSVWPDTPEMRVTGVEAIAWAATMYGALLDRSPAGDLALFEEVLADAGLSRFGFWDRIGAPPRRILTIRCMRQPLFEWFVRYLARVPGATIDVICPAAVAAQTESLPGVGRAIGFDGSMFSVDALSPAQLDAIRREAYDLCVLPRREETGWGFENVTPFGAVCGARTAVWLDIFGRCGLVAGRPHGWEAAVQGRRAPHEASHLYLERAVLALDDFAGSSVDADRGVVHS
jgi:molybdopterin-guanine dinucleotide biosynthesis protein A